MVPQFFLFAVSLLLGTLLVRRFYTAHVIDVIANSFWTRLFSEQTITPLPLHLDDL
jgi:hypothetical protein